MTRTALSKKDEALRSRDRELAQAMARAQSGDSESYRSLLEIAERMLESYLGRSLRRFGLYSESAVEDLVQETLLAIHLKRQTYDPNQPFGPWLYAIARYKLIDFGRVSRREIPSEDLVELADREVSKEDLTPAAESATHEMDLEYLLGSLSQKNRALVVDVKLKEQSIESVSARSGMSESAVKVAIHRAVAFMKKKARADEKSENP